MLNRRKDGLLVLSIEDVEDFEAKKFEAEKGKVHQEEDKSGIKPSDSITRIYACATMWHESEEEQLDMLKSLFRIDTDYNRRKMARNHLKVVDPDYYQWETHILFDDCMSLRDDEEKEVNKFVKQLVRLMDDAASRHYGFPVKIKPCKKIPTPYGGRLIWTLPGKTQIVCHLKVIVCLNFTETKILCF